MIVETSRLSIHLVQKIRTTVADKTHLLVGRSFYKKQYLDCRSRQERGQKTAAKMLSNPTCMFCQGPTSGRKERRVLGYNPDELPTGAGPVPGNYAIPDSENIGNDRCSKTDV